MNPNPSSSAIVLGASVAGLATARALSQHFDHVTVIERDRLPDANDSRKGVPQGNHAHGLLASGYRILDSYFPGMMDELERQGAPRGDVTRDFLWYQYGAWKLRADSGLGGIVVSRPCLEAAVRARVRAIPNVSFLEEHDGEQPIYDPESKRVTGMRVTDRNTGATSDLPADLVVDSSGRGSQAPKWLESWGYGKVPETEVKVDVGYATAVFDRKPGDLYGAMGAIIAGTVPQATRFAAILAAEGDRWIVTLAGALGDYPPTDFDAWKKYAQDLPTRDLLEMVESRQPHGDILSYRFPANRQRHFEQMRAWPSGFLVLGDAVCSFNPVFGQGMSVALTEARALDECLAAGDDELAKRFFARVKKIVASPWLIATGEDFRYPQVQGKRPPGFKLVSKYMERTHQAATRDPVVLRKFFEVANLLAPPTSVMRPSIAWRVALGGRGKAQSSPALAQQPQEEPVLTHAS